MYRFIQSGIFPYLLLSGLYVALHWLVFYVIWPGSGVALLLDAVLYALLITVSGIGLRSFLYYGRLESLFLVQRVGNLLLLGILLVVFISLVSYVVSYVLFGEEISHASSFLLPAKAWIVFLLYSLLLLHFEYGKRNGGKEEELEEEEGLLLEEQTPENSIQVDVLERVTVKTGAKIDVLSVSELLYIESFGDYVYLYSGEGRYIKEQTMKYFEEHLPADLFVRVHRSYIVNVESISRIELYEKQSRQLILKNGDKIKVSPAGYRLLKERLGI